MAFEVGAPMAHAGGGLFAFQVDFPTNRAEAVISWQYGCVGNLWGGLFPLYGGGLLGDKFRFRSKVLEFDNPTNHFGADSMALASDTSTTHPSTGSQAR
jgi:hypothetical protein